MYVAFSFLSAKQIRIFKKIKAKKKSGSNFKLQWNFIKFLKQLRVMNECYLGLVFFLVQLICF